MGNTGFGNQYNQLPVMPNYESLKHEMTFDEIFETIVAKIKSSGQTAKQFLQEYDAYNGRIYQVWEVAAIFEIPIQNARTLAKSYDRKFWATIPVSSFCKDLKQFGVQIDPQGFDGRQHPFKFEAMLTTQKKQLQDLVKLLKDSADLAPNSHSYQEVFYSIAKHLGSASQDKIKSAQVVQALQEKCAKKIQTPQVIVSLIDYVNQSQSQEINVVTFAAALKVIEQDYKVYDLNELLTQVKALDQKQDNLNINVKALRASLWKHGLVQSFKETLRDTVDLQVKVGTGSAVVACVKQQDVSAFMEKMTANGFLNLSVIEKRNILAHYAVVPILKPAVAPKGQAKPENVASSTVLQSSVSLNPEKPEPQVEIRRDSLPKVEEKPQEVEVDDEYEQDDGFEDDERIEEEIEEVKEGGEWFEGGMPERNVQYLNYEQLTVDLEPTKEMLDSTIGLMQTLKFKVLEQMKVWSVVTGDQVLNAFKSGDRKGTLLATKRQVELFVTKIGQDLTKTKEVTQAILQFFTQVNSQSMLCIDYRQFYAFWYEYCLLSKLPARDATIDPEAKAFSWYRSVQYKSLGRLFKLSLALRKAPIEVAKDKFFFKLDKEKKKASLLNKQSYFALPEELKTLMLAKIQGTSTDTVCLLKYQECLGFPAEAEPVFFNQESFRSVCVKLQLQSIQMKLLKQQLGKIKNFQQMATILTSYVSNGNQQEYAQFYPVIQSILTHFITSGYNLNTARFLGKLDFETNKVKQLERFNIKLLQSVKQGQYQDLGRFLHTYQKTEDHSLTRSEFETLLQDMLMICKDDKYDERVGEIRKNELSYFIDEYDQEESGLIMVQRLESDFVEFVSGSESVLEKISEKVFCKIVDNSASLGVHVFRMLGEIMPQSGHLLHTFDFVQWFKALPELQTSHLLDDDMLNMFVDYISIEIGGKHTIDHYKLTAKITDFVKAIPQPVIDYSKVVGNHEDQMLRELKQFKFSVVEKLELLQRSPFDYLTTNYCSQRDLEYKLSEFGITADIAATLVGRAEQVDERALAEELNAILQARSLKLVKYREINKKLKETGFTIETAIQLIKGQQIENFDFSLNDFILLCEGFNVSFDPETELQPILNQLDVDQFGQVRYQTFIDDFNKGNNQANEQGIKQIIAQRNYHTINDTLQQIASDIQKARMVDFGLYLKGNDVKNNDQIPSSVFFEILQTKFETLEKGDILDCVEHFERSFGSIDIQAVAQSLNRLISDQTCLIRLEEHSLIENTIVEPLTPTKASSKHEMPPEFTSTFIDLLSGLFVRKQGQMLAWFGNFEQSQGQIALVEFRAAMAKAGVQSQSIIAIFQYLLTQQENSTMCDTDAMVQHIEAIVKPDFESVSRWVLEQAAKYLHEQEIAVRDTCRKYDTGTGEVLYCDFVFQVLTEDLGLKHVLSRNMIDLLHLRYNPKQAQNVLYESFIQDLVETGQQLKMQVFELRQETGQPATHRSTQKEPDYTVRSNKNTYCQTAPFGTEYLQDAFLKKCCDDILIQTRQRSFSVESWFQQYGQLGKDSERLLDSKEFRTATADLNVSWAVTASKQLFKAIELIFDYYHGISVEQIGCVVFMNSSVDLKALEAEAIEQVHQCMLQQGLLKQIREFFNFNNFERDGTMSIKNFEQVLCDTLKLEGRVANLHLLIQKYRQLGTESVSQYQFLQDLVYQHNGINLVNQKQALIAENILKYLLAQQIIATGQGFDDHDQDRELKQFISKQVGRSVQLQDLERIFKILQMKDDVLEFYKYCSVVKQGKLKPVDLSMISEPQSIDTLQFTESLIRLNTKPASALYCDVLDYIYLNSKRRNVSISGPHLLYLFNAEAKQGLIKLEVFIERIQTKVCCDDSISYADIQFLATKYVKRGLVDFNMFMEDYYQHERGNLGQCVDMLFKQPQSGLSVQTKAVSQLPAEPRELYNKMGKYCQTKDLDEFLCGEFINKDTKKSGFLSKVQLKEAIKRVGIPISENQLSILTSVLTAKLDQYNYLEMISYLFGLVFMQTLQAENNIWGQQELSVDLTALTLTQQLQDQLTLKVLKVKSVYKQNIFDALNQVQIAVQSKDHQTLKMYFENAEPTLSMFLQHFKIDQQPALLLADLVRQLKGKSQTFQPYQSLQFGDFKNCLIKQQIVLPKSNDVLVNLFQLIADRQAEVTRHTLERCLEIDQEIVQSARDVFKSFQAFVIAGGHNLVLEFGQVRRIPEQQFSKWLERIKFMQRRELIRLFTEKDGVNLPKLIQFIRKEHPDYGKQNLQQVAQLPLQQKIILQKLCIQLSIKQVTVQQLCKQLDRNLDGKVTSQELDDYLVENKVCEGFTSQQIKALFDCIDVNQDGHLAITELSNIIGCYQAWHGQRLQSFTNEFEASLVKEIEVVFDQLDTEQLRTVGVDELVIACKQLDPVWQLTPDRAKEVIDEVSTDSRMTKQQFVQFMLRIQKEQLLSLDYNLDWLELEFLRHEENQRVNKQQLAKMLNLTAQEIDVFWQDLDQVKAGSVNYNQLKSFVSLADQLAMKSSAIIHKIKKNAMGLNENIDLIKQAPKHTTLSITQNIRGSKIKPKFDFKCMQYVGLCRDFKVSKEFIMRNKPAFCFEFSVLDVVGLPLHSDHVELRCFIFDITRKLCMSNVQTYQANCKPWSAKDAMLVRSNRNYQLVFELVSIDIKQPTKQTVLAWAQCQLQQTKQGKLNLPLLGGSAFSEKQEIVSSQPKQGFFASIKSKTDRHLTVDIKFFDKLDETTQAQICTLQEDQIVSRKLLGFITSFQLFAHRQLIKCELLLQLPAPNHIIAAFDSIYDSPDLQQAIGLNWATVTANQTQEQQIETMCKIITRLQPLLFDPGLQFDLANLNRTSTGELQKQRNAAATRVIVQDQSKQTTKPRAVAPGIMFMDDYMPFNAQQNIHSQLGLDRETERLQQDLLSTLRQ